MTIEAADVVISGDEPKANGPVGQVIRQLDMRGLYHVFGGDEGAPRHAYGWMFAGIGLDFLGIDDNPMYALLIQQPRVVRLLEKRARDLGVDIRWGHELTALRPGVQDVARRHQLAPCRPVPGR
jgi:2-polyprenyl-6-methoxyphenol hydroxylase-like FAD-dependent oxidoreductase